MRTIKRLGGMTETTTLPNPSTEAEPDGDFDPIDILLNVIVTLLAPMFLVGSGGDIPFARMAALQTVSAYRARNEEDLISIVQIIAFGLAALGSLSRSMEDNLSVSMMLRLRGNANACNRSAEHNRRALRDSRAETQAAANANPASSPDEGFDEAELRANVAAVLKRTGQTRPPAARSSEDALKPDADRPLKQRELESVTPKQSPAKPQTIPAPPIAAAAPLIATASPSDRELQAVWAAAMARVATRYTADLPNLPPAARREASIRANALSSCAHDLLVGNVVPRLRPGDLAALMQPNKR